MAHPTKHLPDKICPICGTSFNRKRYNGTLEDSTRYISRKTCSRSCGSTLVEPTDRTTYHFRARSFRLLSCEMCGSEQNLDAHHKDGNIKNNTPENIQTLCHSCHMKLHWSIRKKLKDITKTDLSDSKPLETP